MVDLLPWSLSQNLLSTLPQALTKYPHLESGCHLLFCPSEHLPFKLLLLDSVYPLGEPTVSLWTLHWCRCAGVVLRDRCTPRWPDRIFTVSMWTSNPSAILALRKESDSRPVPPCLSCSVAGYWLCPRMPNRITFFVSGYHCSVVDESDDSSAQVTQGRCGHVMNRAPPICYAPYQVRGGEEDGYLPRFILRYAFIYVLYIQLLNFNSQMS